MGLPFGIFREPKQTLLSWAPQLRLIANRKEWLYPEFTWQPYQVSISAGGTMTATPSELRGLYIKIGQLILIEIRAVFTTAVAANPIVNLTLPISTSPNGDMGAFTAQVTDGGAGLAGVGVTSAGSSTLQVSRYDGANWGLGAGRIIRVSGAYEAL